jgi:hypothetical protein
MAIKNLKKSHKILILAVLVLFDLLFVFIAIWLVQPYLKSDIPQNSPSPLPANRYCEVFMNPEEAEWMPYDRTDDAVKIPTTIALATPGKYGEEVTFEGNVYAVAVTDSNSKFGSFRGYFIRMTPGGMLIKSDTSGEWLERIWLIYGKCAGYGKLSGWNFR